MTAPGELVVTVAPVDDGLRIDVLVARMPEVESRAEAQRLMADGRVSIDGAVASKRVVVAAGQTIAVRPRARAGLDLTPEDIPLAVRFEDDFLMIVDKPAGLVTHPSKGHETGTLVHGLLARGIRGGEAERPGIVHRLDRDTSGLLVVAKTDRVHRRLQRMMSDRAIDRRYVALVHGVFPPALSIDRAIGRDRRNRLKMSTRTERPRDARTHLRRLAAYERHSLVEARLETGRTHQIRVHLEAAGFPVVGDPLYGRQGDQLGLERQFLHAWQLAFTHPETGEEIDVRSELPADLAAAKSRLAHSQAAAR